MVDRMLIIFMLAVSAFLLLSIYLMKRKMSSQSPDIEALAAMLPNANCGACGNPGCRELAAKLLRGRAAPDACVSGGELTAVKIARFLGLEEDSFRNRY
jgi:H+/Na+-translocating ferredoxin:NAD+ oxidoreductase subunit B